MILSRVVTICLLAFAAGTAGKAFAGQLTLAAVNGADLTGVGKKKLHAISSRQKRPQALVIKAQVLLDRAGFSSGVIDGRVGENFANAVRAFQEQNGLKPSGDLDAPTWARLVATSVEPVLAEHVITADEAKGPFVAEIPGNLEKKAELKRLAYTGPAELLAEKFHLDEDLLAELNRGKSLEQAGASILIASVPQAPPKAQVVRVVVEKAKHSVRAFDREGKLVGFYPASIGSDEKPAPTGRLKITRVVRDPPYTYNPEFRFRGVNAHSKLKIAPGPNNPVGAVWMNLNEQSYGIHGTAEPTEVGKAGSHGCVRMTNWDALTLAAMVRKGTIVEFVD